jgi:hypothetical protein
VLVTGALGVGKSRVRQEFVARIHERALVLLARADSIAAGSSLSAVRQLVRQAAELSEAVPEHQQYARLRNYLHRFLALTDSSGDRTRRFVSTTRQAGAVAASGSGKSGSSESVWPTRYEALSTIAADDGDSRPNPHRTTAEKFPSASDSLAGAR